jgi:hypothetical protein
MVSLKIDLIILNLVLMPHKFGINASNLVLMPKKIGGRSHYNFFFLNYVLRKTKKERHENLRGELIAFFIYIYY